MKAKKSFGQHFLKYPAIAESIASALTETEKYKLVLEVGPGQGMLTQFLVDQDYEFWVVEADRDMVPLVRKRFPQLNGHILEGDFMKLDVASTFGNRPMAIIGNFPYNISSQILFKAVENREQVVEVVGMFQYEMAQRVVSSPGSKAYGVISVLVQAYYEGEFLFPVEPEAFSPPPKVRSGVIRLVRRPDEEVLGCDEKLFRRVVKQAFSQRRKMLRNTMKTFIKGSDILQEEFFQQRPERLTVADYVDLTNRIAKIIRPDQNEPGG